MSRLVSEVLLSEYETYVAEVGHDAPSEAIMAILVRDGAWTESGARLILSLAQNYGTSMLRNALALAEAMGIEDGAAGF